VFVKVSEAANLAIHALTYLANDRGTAPVSTATVAGVLGASEAHLTKVFQRLKRVGLVDSTRGPKGGVSLAREPGQVRILDIYETIDGPLGNDTCLLGKSGCMFKQCVFGGMLTAINDLARSYMSSTTLADLVTEPSAFEQS